MPTSPGYLAAIPPPVLPPSFDRVLPSFESVLRSWVGAAPSGWAAAPSGADMAPGEQPETRTQATAARASSLVMGSLPPLMIHDACSVEREPQRDRPTRERASSARGSRGTSERTAA